MNYNYKDKFRVYHETGKFTESQLKEILDAAYELGKKDGYNDGYAAGKLARDFYITYPSYPYWYTTTDKTYPVNYNTITCNDVNVPTVWNESNSSNIPNSVTTTATTTNNICREFKYNGTER